ncbi:MAG: 23S rRNA (pseudouridine(1915)-N(3))-methyltransferase RlmH [Eubacteriales bacterium]|nr:23S rRNA (pseudouridine(1915)-N(3))-methyltransferase RlmH [Eubacteriales bacterium]
MVQIKIVCVGKLKEDFYRDAVAEFEKRLSRFCTLDIIEVPDEKAPEKLSNLQRLSVLQKEGDAVLDKLDPQDYVVALAISGVAYTSESFAYTLGRWMTEGKSRLAFVIGGSLGLSMDVMQRADSTLSFSTMTFSHQMARIILLEQVYRSFKINNNEPYHK